MCHTFMYFPDLTLASFGSSASAGIAYEYPILTAPGIRLPVSGGQKFPVSRKYVGLNNTPS